MSGISPIRRTQVPVTPRRAEVSLTVLASFPNVADRGTYPQHRVDQADVSVQPGSRASEVLPAGQPKFVAKGQTDTGKTYRIDTPDDVATQRTSAPQPQSTGLKPQHLLSVVLVLFAIALGIMVVRGRDQPAQVAPQAWPSSNEKSSGACQCGRAESTAPSSDLAVPDKQEDWCEQ